MGKIFRIILLFIPWILMPGMHAQTMNTSDSIPDASLDQSFIINKITLHGNKVTKNFIIYREMEFGAGDSIRGNELNTKLRKTRENLLNTSLFNFVTIRLDTVDINHYVKLDVNIELVERWYIWPFPIFEFADRNFNAWLKTKDFSKVNYGGYLVWDNFRGRKEKAHPAGAHGL
ncbi:MAG: POTRA domain-containing protein [Bacteroidota bacterium]|nr:POTRA domain-containing protein [Bacteroidota bacterium]